MRCNENIKTFCFISKDGNILDKVVQMRAYLIAIETWHNHTKFSTVPRQQHKKNYERYTSTNRTHIAKRCSFYLLPL